MHRKVPVRFGPGAARKRACTTGTSPAAYRCFFVLEACGLAVQLVNAAQARNLPGRPKTDKLDAQWLARLTEMGLLRASFVPPRAIRDLRDYTRARTRLVHERTRCWQRLEKLLEGDLLTELPDVAAAQEAQPSPRPIIGCPKDPDRQGMAAISLA